MKKNPLSNFGRMLKSFRLDNELTQLQVAKELGVSITAVSHWETGRRLPRATARYRLADLYGHRVEETLVSSLEQFSQRDLVAIVIDLLERRV